MVLEVAAQVTLLDAIAVVAAVVVFIALGKLIGSPAARHQRQMEIELAHRILARRRQINERYEQVRLDRLEQAEV